MFIPKQRHTELWIVIGQQLLVSFLLINNQTILKHYGFYSNSAFTWCTNQRELFTIFHIPQLTDALIGRCCCH